MKTIRCDHGTEFKNQLMNEFCAKKGIKKEYNIARTPQQNDQLEKFDGKSEEGYLLGYSTNSKAVHCSWSPKHCHSAQPMHSEERTADKEVPLSSKEQALHDELMRLMHQESLAKAHNDAQRNAFEKEKRIIEQLEKGKRLCRHVLFTLSTTLTHLLQSTDTEEGGAADYNNMDPTINVTSTPTLRIHKNHPQSQIIGNSTAGVLTRRKLKESDSVQHQALLSFIYKQNRTNLQKDQTDILLLVLISKGTQESLSSFSR
ncbi:putative ribonuclease H-like domain-containing protein [Tanacetum coccineum]